VIELILLKLGNGQRSIGVSSFTEMLRLGRWSRRSSGWRVIVFLGMGSWSSGINTFNPLSRFSFFETLLLLFLGGILCCAFNKKL